MTINFNANKIYIGDKSSTEEMNELLHGNVYSSDLLTNKNGKVLNNLTINGTLDFDDPI